MNHQSYQQQQLRQPQQPSNGMLTSSYPNYGQTGSYYNGQMLPLVPQQQQYQPQQQQQQQLQQRTPYPIYQMMPSSMGHPPPLPLQHHHDPSLAHQQPMHQAHQHLLNAFWARQMYEIQNVAQDYKLHYLPLARIKKVMKTDDDVKVENLLRRGRSHSW